jgi:hypothetical protein
MISEERIYRLWAAACNDPVGVTLTTFARSVAREARREAIEECAKVCDERRGPIEIYNKSYPAMMDCAAAIRALSAT